MIISEKQVHELMLVANIYLRLLEDIARAQPDALSKCGQHNKIHVANLIQEIVNQQPVVHMVIK